MECKFSLSELTELKEAIMLNIHMREAFMNDFCQKNYIKKDGTFPTDIEVQFGFRRLDQLKQLHSKIQELISHGS